MKQMIKFLADECVFSLTVELLKNRGWNVVTVREVGLQGVYGKINMDKVAK